ncbi:MAG: DNA-binding response regulator [Nitrospirae bacterium]|nr:MAG: DNA-binding response regulator [Nitrospirota bacterium]
MSNILIVDDDPDILKVLVANLSIAGFTADTAINCAEARRYISENNPDLIILDLMLPDCDGIELCRELRGKHLDTPIIMLTARDEVTDRVIGLESGADDYVVKPFEAIELVARVRACLRRKTTPSEGTITAGEIDIDLATRRVTVKGSEIELTPREFDLLCLFAKNPEKVLSRDFIRKAVWKDSKRLYSWSRVIDVHIQHLRKKIEKDPTKPEYILTVPGVGYRFCTGTDK